MGHDIVRLYRGYAKPDLAAFVSASCEERSVRDLPGFVHDNVTYESHHFWLHFLHYKVTRPTDSLTTDPSRARDVLIVVHHGGGWEVWRADYFFARIIARVPDDMAAFWMCWHLMDVYKDAHARGVRETADEYRKAFVDGRLRKRKMPGRDVAKVWIDPPDASKPAA